MHNPLPTLLFILLVLTSLTGCGQKGDLYLPETAQQQEILP